MGGWRAGGRGAGGRGQGGRYLFECLLESLHLLETLAAVI